MNRLGMYRQAIAHKRRTGLLGYRRLNDRVLVSRASVEAYLVNQPFASCWD